MDEEHDFHPCHSTITCNAIFCHYIYDAFANHSQIDVFYTDFAKVFDRVDHLALINVLRETRFGEPLSS